ncbi:MAG: hypothetical protein MRY83_05415 [Flavobacteriales bacterium]|nr:hypothetical protein [Flavobacteriales bacterium]
MKTKSFIYITSLLLIILIGLFSCKKDTDDFVNPYDQNNVILNPVDTAEIPSENFAYLHEKVFLPTCANSGCHDGTFEPDFRTISSTYNTTVNHSVITNDQSASFQYRVKPGSSSESLLFVRLETFLPNTSGIMPLEVEPESDWPEKKSEYIAAIKAWIDGGAKYIDE